MSTSEQPAAISPLFLRIAGALLILAAAPALELPIPAAGVPLAFLQSAALAGFYIALAIAGYPRRDGTSIGLALAQSVVHVLLIVVVLTSTELGVSIPLIILLSIVLFALNIAYGVSTFRTRTLLDPLRQLPLALAIGAFVTHQIENLLNVSWSHIFVDLLYVVVGILFIAYARFPNGRTLEEWKP